ncbi:efflux transporter outer membrane subunit [Novosphingobium cyanobacteriorum]|uniref:Efflux transporter outer membrane subunit n=1 Tax=Novosphingobium cyanobacteriorum TaxID=3024215 RepID=A0ABT6CKS1_9SPHN|nr:efflux transporter outer membrane subunit [Novosphingobium cyanobacteriorum]MDF8333858.1 efflux transporter outer membrane subunit [Novosphingobium cyanobacteriorum]
MPKTRNISLLLMASAALAACTTVGPNYKGAPGVADAAAARSTFLRAPLGASNTVPASQWWTVLNDPQLDRLITMALADAPDIAIANARIAQARAGLAANRTALLPSLNVSGTAPYFNVPGGLFSADGQGGGRDSVQVYNLGFDSSWEIDLFGGTRRKIEAANARAEAAEAGLADAQVTLSAEIARAYVSLRAKQAAAAIQMRQADIDRALVGYAEERLRAGTAPAQPLAQARATLAQSEADLASTQADITVLQDQIALLVGKEPGALDAQLAGPSPIPLPPAEVALGDPATMLRNRPDVRRAERQLAAANADIGVQIANRFPKISFLGLLGLGGQSIGDIFDPSKIIGLAVPQIKWSLFDGGRTEAQVSSARGAFAEADAAYRKTVLGALQDAEGSLTRFGALRTGYGKALEGEAQARKVAELQAQRANGGTISTADALAAERQALSAALNAASQRAALTTGFVAVEKALGLGWQAGEPQK